MTGGAIGLLRMLGSPNLSPQDATQISKEAPDPFEFSQEEPVSDKSRNQYWSCLFEALQRINADSASC